MSNYCILYRLNKKDLIDLLEEKSFRLLKV